MSHTDHLLVEHGHRLQHAQVDEARLLEAGDDLDLDAPSARARSMNTARFSASRTAEVATARMVAPVDGRHLPEPHRAPRCRG